MPANDKRGRYTLRFNPADPQQEKVIRLLDEQGRHKAAFITSAVLSYVQGDGVVPYAATSCDAEQIRQIVLDVLAKQNGLGNQQEESDEFVDVSATEKGAIISAQSTPEDIPLREEKISSDMLSAVSSALKGFRK